MFLKQIISTTRVNKHLLLLCILFLNLSTLNASDEKLNQLDFRKISFLNGNENFVGNEALFCLL